MNDRLTSAPAAVDEESSPRDGLVSLDIIIPVYNERDVLPLLIERLDAAFSEAVCASKRIQRLTLMFVDDGSSDDSVELVRTLLRTRAHLHATVIRLSRNFGHQAAVSAGIHHSNADVSAIIDADLQDVPELIPEMLERWRDGYDVVYAQRTNRKEGVIKRALYWVFYRLYQALSPIDVAVDSGDFCLISRRVVEALRSLPESVRFPRGLRSWVGFAQTAIAYDRPARAAGRSRYGFRQLYELATDGITSISIRPLKLAQLLGLGYLVLAVGIFALLLATMSTRTSEDLRFAMLMGVMLFSNALVLFCLYIIGAYVGRTYLEAKRRPTYIVRDIVDVANPTRRS